MSGPGTSLRECFRRTSRWVEGCNEPPAVPTPSGGSLYLHPAAFSSPEANRTTSIAHNLLAFLRSATGASLPPEALFNSVIIGYKLLMERRDGKVIFNILDYGRTGLRSVPVAEAAATAQQLYEQSSRLFEQASATVPRAAGMAIFNKAIDRQMAASELTKYIPAPEIDDAELVADDVEAFLRDVS